VADLFAAPALKRLPDLIDEATKRTVVIVSGDRAVKLTPVRAPQQRARHFGWQSLFEPQAAVQSPETQTSPDAQLALTAHVHSNVVCVAVHLALGPH
jgi:hypothetical protein